MKTYHHFRAIAFASMNMIATFETLNSRWLLSSEVYKLKLNRIKSNKALNRHGPS